MSEIRRYDTFNDVEFPSTDGPYYMVADADAKVSELEQQVKAARELLAEYRKRVTWAATSDSKLQIPEDLRDQYYNAPAIGRFDNPTTYVRYLIERIAGQAAKLAALANELLAANMAWSNKCEENATLRKALDSALETCKGIVDSDWRKWEELASPEEYERWSKSRANHTAVNIRAALIAASAHEPQKENAN